MERFVITGGTPLRGSVGVHGAKNSALKLMAASLLAPGSYTFRDVPHIADISIMRAMLQRLGCLVVAEDDTISVDVPAEPGHEAPYELVRQMRASIVVLGPLLARLGHARVAMPGGCNIGSRKIDLHLKGLERMGAVITFDHGYLDAAGSLRGTDIVLDWPSHGATENLMMAATLAKGTTVIDNAAREPEVADLARLLGAMGARIDGAGTERIEIEGVPALGGGRHRIIPDRIEAGTLLVAGAITGGDVTVTGVVTVKDENGAAVPGASVAATWKLPDGSRQNRSANSDTTGNAKFSTLGGRGTYTLTVTNITKPGYDFDNANSVLNKSITK